MKSTSHISTESASAYIRKLCKHFAHKIKTEYSENAGHAEFEMGICLMRATPTELIFEIEAAEKDAADRIKDIVVTHLMKFAFREALQIDWHDESTQEPDWEEMARQLRSPEGDRGIQTALNMNKSNSGMTRRAIELLNLQNSAHVLEIGPGNAAHLSELMGMADELVYTGIDISQTMVAEATKLNDGLSNVVFLLSDGLKINFSDGVFDRIFTANTLYFWENPLAYAREIKRVLKPGGRFCLAFAGRDFMEQLPFTRHNFKLFDADAGAGLLQEAGFKVIEVLTETEKILSNTGTEVDRTVIFVLAGSPV